jgi:hypothetical protein
LRKFRAHRPAPAADRSFQFLPRSRHDFARLEQFVQGSDHARANAGPDFVGAGGALRPVFGLVSVSCNLLRSSVAMAERSIGSLGSAA